MIAKELMRRHVFSVREGMSLDEVCDLFQQEHIHGAPVVDEQGTLVGFVSLEDILYGSMGGGDEEGSDGLRVRDVMTAPPVYANEETSVNELCRIMWRLRLHHVPIVRDGKVTGIVSALDLCRAISEGEIGI